MKPISYYLYSPFSWVSYLHFYSGIFLFFFIFMILPVDLSLSANPGKKAMEMCNCLEKGMKSQNAKDKKRCLRLQEKHTKALKDGSKAHEEYKKAVFACEGKLRSEKEDSGPVPEGFENQKKAVCDCFANTKPPMKCFRMQGELAKLQGDRRVEFIKATNACAP